MLFYNTNYITIYCCLNGKARNVGGKPKIDLSFSKNINCHMKKQSEIAANRYLIKLKKNARYRVGTYKSAYNSYPLREKICFSTFRNKICKSFKKPYRLSDLCDICENGKVREFIDFLVKKICAFKILLK